MKFTFVAKILLLLLLAAGCKRSVESVEIPEQQHPGMRRARAAELAGNYADAADIYHEVLLKSPTMASAHLQLAIIYHDHLKEYIEAIYHYRRYLAMRAESEKGEMIKGRIVKAEQMLTSQAARSLSANDPSGQVALMQQIDNLNSSLLRSESDKRALVATNSQLEARITELNGRIKRLELWVERLQREPEMESSTSQRRLTPRQGGADNRAAGAHTYEVRPGDSLSRIAEFAYGDATLWPRIRDANREKLGNGERVRVGDVLIIP